MYRCSTCSSFFALPRLFRVVPRFFFFFGFPHFFFDFLDFLVFPPIFQLFLFFFFFSFLFFSPFHCQMSVKIRCPYAFSRVFSLPDPPWETFCDIPYFDDSGIPGARFLSSWEGAGSAEVATSSISPKVSLGKSGTHFNA